jgi:hypothetical protein
MDGLLLVVERCGGCGGMFPICRCCYHGQTYCGKSCRVPARATQARAARSKYQLSLHGRRVRSERRRERRDGAASITNVMDQGPEEVAPTSSVCLPQGPHAPMTGVVETEGRSQDDDVSLDDDDVLKAVLRTPSSPPHPRALPSLLEAMALWHQTPVHVVLCANEEASWCQLGLLDDMWLGIDAAHYTVELRPRDGVRERRHRIAGLGSFNELRQLALRGVP